MTQGPQASTSQEGKDLAVDYAMFYPTEKVGNTKKRRTVMLLSMPVCAKTKSGFNDTIEGYLDRNGITVVWLSNTVVAIVPDKKFVEGQVAAILDSVARYRNLTPDKLARRRLSGASATALRNYFEQQLPRLYERLKAKNGTHQLATNHSG